MKLIITNDGLALLIFDSTSQEMHLDIGIFYYVYVMLLQLMTNQKIIIIALLLRFLKGNLKIRRQRKTWFSCASSFLWNENRKWKTIISFAHFEATKSFCNKNIFSKTDKTHFGLTDKGSEVLSFKCWTIRINVYYT